MDRLNRFFALVKNEYIKILKKGGTFAILILMLFAVFAFEFVLCTNIEKKNYYLDADFNTNYKAEIDRYSKSNLPFSDKKVEMLQTLEKLGVSWGSWGYNALSWYIGRDYSKTDKFPQEQVDKTVEFIKNDDWKGYLEYHISLDSIPQNVKKQEQFRLKYDVKPDEDSYRNDLFYKISSIIVLESDDGDGSSIPSKQRDELALVEYQLENDIAYNINIADPLDEVANTWGAWAASGGLVSVVAIAMMIFAGNIVANEYSNGTIKFLLVNPVKRWKILASKLVTILSLSVVLLLIVFLISGLCSALFIGTNGLKAASLSVKDGVVTSSSPLVAVVGKWLLESISMFVMVVLAFSLSTFSRKSSIAIALSIVALLIGSVVSSLLAQFDCDWGRYLLFSNLDIGSIARGETLYYRQSVGFAVFVIVEHIIVFLVTAFDAFRKKSV